MANGKPRVLIIEDDPFMSSLLADGLGRAGLEAVLAANAVDAIQKFSETKPDAVVLDILLPGRSGLEVLAEIRALPGGGVPAIILSNVEEIGYVQEAERLGAAAYLVKANMEVSDIVAKVRETLARAKS